MGHIHLFLNGSSFVGIKLKLSILSKGSLHLPLHWTSSWSWLELPRPSVADPSFQSSQSGKNALSDGCFHCGAMRGMDGMVCMPYTSDRHWEIWRWLFPHPDLVTSCKCLWTRRSAERITWQCRPRCLAWTMTMTTTWTRDRCLWMITPPSTSATFPLLSTWKPV